MAKPRKELGAREIADRISKVDMLRDAGINPYPYTYNPTHSTVEVDQQFGEETESGSTLDESVRVAGRVMVMRKMGNMTFLDIHDQHGRIQAVMQRDVMGNERYLLMRKALDRGDIVGVDGNVMRTNRGELSIRTTDLKILTKTIRPLPSKEWITEEGDRKGGLASSGLYRQPALGFIIDPTSRDVMVKRSRAISLMRKILERDKYLEVEIPTLQPVYGGASARPFTTRVNALSGTEVFLSISLTILKSGLSSVPSFEISVTIISFIPKFSNSFAKPRTFKAVAFCQPFLYIIPLLS